jgi:light-regulated signal transduction histidine kinase (bacteriophytochrome)
MIKTRIRIQGQDIRHFILAHVEKHPIDIAKITAQHFGITRQAVNKHIQKLVADSFLAIAGETRNKRYTLCPLLEWEKKYSISPELSESQVWLQDIQPLLVELPSNVLNIWGYGFTEMFNNAIDHSEEKKITVHIKKMAAKILITIVDNGIGIFRKIQTRKHLIDERHAILELSKGKLTTDPKNHSGGRDIFYLSNGK